MNLADIPVYDGPSLTVTTPSLLRAGSQCIKGINLPFDITAAVSYGLPITHTRTHTHRSNESSVEALIVFPWAV